MKYLKYWPIAVALLVVILVAAGYFALKDKFIELGKELQAQAQTAAQVQVIQQKLEINDQRLDQQAKDQQEMRAQQQQFNAQMAQLNQTLSAMVQMQKQQLEEIKSMKRPEVLDAILKEVGPPQAGEVQQPVLASDSQLKTALTLFTERSQCLDREKVKDDQLQNCELRATNAETLSQSQQQTIAELNLKMGHLEEISNLKLAEKDDEIKRLKPSFAHRIIDKIWPVLPVFGVLIGLAF